MKELFNLFFFMLQDLGPLVSGICVVFSLLGILVNYPYISYYRDVAKQMGISVSELDDLHRKDYHDHFKALIGSVIMLLIMAYVFLTSLYNR